MGIIKSINDWEEDVGENVGDYIQDTLTKTTEFLCGIRAKYPNSFFDRSFGRGLANSICRNLGSGAVLPEPAPFAGGQCVGVQYEVLMTADPTFNGAPRAETSARLVLFGPITDAGVNRPIPGNDPRIIGFFAFGKDVLGNDFETASPIGGVGWEAELTSIQVNRIDGLADTCGNVEPSFPPDPPRDSSDFSTTVTVCDRDEDGNEINCEEVEVVLPEEDTINFPVCVVVDGKKICLDADGWTIEDAPFEEPVKPDDLEEETGEETEEESEEDERIRWVSVEITTLPSQGKQIFHRNSVDNDYIGGWLVWTVKAGGRLWHLPALPIRKTWGIFDAPDGVAGYRIYAVNSAKLRPTVYKVPIEE